jgi:amino acid adenylation domain-containing protein
MSAREDGSLVDSLFGSEAHFPDRVALVAGEHGITYRELAAQVRSLARFWLERGIQRGDRVVVLAANSAASAVAFWAVLACGGVVVMVNPGTRRDKLAWLLADSGAAALIADAELVDASLPAVASTSLLLVVIGASSLASATSFEDALTLGARAARSLPSASPDDLAALLYTSGSTGEPKAVMLTQRNITSAAASISGYLGLNVDDVLLGVLPLSFDYGLYQLILSARVGARLVLERSFSLPGQVLNRVAKERVTVLPGVPTLFAMLARLGDLRRWDLSSIRVVTSTAAALGPESIHWLRSTFPQAQVFSMYGLTECKRCTYLPPADLERKPGSVGIAIPGNEIWLVDEEDRVLGPNRVGQLVVRGPTVMAGYWRRPEATARRLRAGPQPGERVLYTGDLCRMDDEGYLYFVRRMDDVIKSRGEKVAPAEVEAVLRALPGVLDAAVVGVPDELLGHALKAFVILEPSSHASASTLRAACRERLEPVMVPREVVLVPTLPRTANGKIEKAALV